MTLLTSLLALPGTDTLAWTLVHFLWQGTLVALAAAALLCWAARSAHARYLLGVGALALMLAAPVATFVVLDRAAPVPMAAAVSTTDATAIASLEGLAAPPSAAGALAPASVAPVVLPAVVVLWFAGVLALSVRLVGGWLVARRIAASAAQPVGDHVRAMAAHVAGRLGLHRMVRIAESSTVAVPIVVGWLKPIVLLPAAAVTGLSLAQVEALIAHELAHVRRQDYLVNLLQSVVETLLFYHPAVWWISRQVRAEREHCCDDLAVTVCDRVVYVHALTDLAAMRVHTGLALAATDGSLLGRVRRLLTSDADERPSAGWLSIALVVSIAAVVTPAIAIGAGDPQAPPVPVLVAPTAVPIAAPSAVRPVAGPAASAAAVPVAAPESTPIAGTVMPTQATPTVPNEARRQAELEALRQQMSAAAAELERVRQQRAEVQANQVRQEMALLREAAAARLTELQQALRTAATRHDVGLADEQAVVAARAQVAEAERELTLAHVQADAFELSTKLEAQRGQAEREFQRAQDLYAAAQATSEASPQAVAPAGTAEQKIYRLHEGITPPTLQRRVEPEYPPLAKAARMQGPVYVDAVIGRDGRVRDAKATGGAPFPPLREAAVAAVREWEYTPTILNGAPVEVQLSVQVVFKLDGNSAPRAPAVPVQTNAFPVEDATAQVRVGDLLVIDIAGENQLPRWYIVEAGGIVRLPLIGRLQVENQTASQVRDTIAAALATRQLAQGKAVTVVIHRGK